MRTETRTGQKTDTEQHWLFPSALANDNVQANW